MSTDNLSITPRGGKRQYMSDALSLPEQSALQDYEATIEGGLQTFYDVGEALLAIRDKRLYRQEYTTFEDYCRERWNLKQSRAYQFMDAAVVVNSLKSSTIVELPANEAQARPLTSLAPQDQPIVWQAAIETAPNGTVTAEHVKSVVRSFQLEQDRARKRDSANASAAREIQRRETPPDWNTNDAWSLLCGDILEQGATIADNSVPYIITDPPYGSQYRMLYQKLATLAARVLIPGGSLICMTGQSDLQNVMETLSAGLRYRWMFCYLTLSGQSPQIWTAKVNTFWKPLLWYTKEEYNGDWHGDVVRSAAIGDDKRFHEWGQSVATFEDMVIKFTYPDQLIVDPFCGAGTTGIAAIRQKRRFIGIDVDPDAIENARERLTSCQ